MANIKNLHFSQAESRSNAARSSSLHRRDFLSTGLGAALLLSLTGTASLPLTALARDAQGFDELWLDASRKRELPVKLRLPSMPGPWPVVIFSHGLGGSREGGAFWGQAWAEAGYLVLHLQHPGSDAKGVRDDRRAAMSGEQLLLRAQDVSFALDEMQRRKMAGQGAWALADLTRIGMSGHSFGALTTMAVAGQRFPGGKNLSEPQLKAFLALSPGTGGRFGPQQQPMQERYGSLRGPFMFITGTLDGDVVGSGETPEGHTIPFIAASPGDKYLWVLKDADHMTFGGQKLGRLFERYVKRTDVAMQSDAAHQAQVQAITTHYWNAMLKDDAQARAQLKQPAEVAAQDVWKTK